MSKQRFKATVEARPGGGVAIRIPFDPSEVWGEKGRHYVTGSIDGCTLRGRLASVAGAHVLQLGPSWNCARFEAGDDVTVELEPEGPQLATMPSDVVSALESEPEARRFFEALATHYRKNFVSWIDGAKRPETRARRIDEAVDALKAGRRER